MTDHIYYGLLFTKPPTSPGYNDVNRLLIELKAGNGQVIYLDHLLSDDGIICLKRLSDTNQHHKLGKYLTTIDKVARYNCTYEEQRLLNKIALTLIVYGINVKLGYHIISFDQ